MPLQPITATDASQRLADFDAVIDARSESEFALDRLPGAVNWPSLSDAERVIIGTEYKQLSAFTAKKRGAVLVARNIALHIERELLEAPREWKPLIYCWRGGNRSNSLAMVLSQIGFKVHLLEGGYTEFRRLVLTDLETLPLQFNYRVICGKTGSGKSRLLTEMTRQGAQVLDLEALANHRGSVLGLVPGSPQPSQKQFDTRIWHALRHFDATRTVWIESESKKVGELRVPQSLIERMRASPCLRLELSVDARIKLLMEDYDFFVQDIAAFCERLDALRALRGHDVINAWQEAARNGLVERVVRELLIDHYDPVYLASMKRNFSKFDEGQWVAPADGDLSTLVTVARKVLA